MPVRLGINGFGRTGRALLSELTMVHGRLVKVLRWYDNESGYSSRLADLPVLVGAAGC